MTKKRMFLVAGTVASVGAVVALVAGVTFGFFSATTPTRTDSFTAGSVSLAQSAVTDCAITNMVPGNESAGYTGGYAGNTQSPKHATCTFQVTYTGSAPAYLALDVDQFSNTPGNPVQAYGDDNSGTTPAAASGLYDSSATGLQFQIKDNTSTSYMSGVTVDGGTLAPGTEVDNLLVNNTPMTTGQTRTFTVDYALPETADNAYQQAASSISLLVHAVQAGNNGGATTTNVLACTPGSTCGAVTSWN